LNIGELFLNLGIKGTEKTIGAVQGVSKGLGEVKSMSLEAKAAIIAAIYSLERMMSAAGKTGTSLSLFSATTGMSSQMMERFKFAAQQVGVVGDEVETSMKGVQDKMVGFLRGEGAPKGLEMFRNYMHSIGKEVNESDLLNIPKMFMDIQDFSRSGPPELLKDLTTSLGITENTFAAMTKNAFRPDVMDRAPVHSDKQVDTLNKVDVAWANLGTKVKFAFDALTSKHGLPIINDISKLTEKVFDMISAFSVLADKLKVFQVIGKVFEGWGLIFDGLNKSIDGVNKSKGGVLDGLKKEGASWFQGISEATQGAVMMIQEAMEEGAVETGGNKKPSGKPKFGDVAKSIGSPIKTNSVISPSVKNAGTSKTVNVNQNQTLNFKGDGKDHKEVSEAHGRAAREAHKQIPDAFWTSSAHAGGI
jgi:hypothetical protein